MTDLVEHAYFPSNINTHGYENFNIGTIDLVSVPVYNELNIDYTNLKSLKDGVDNEYNSIIADKNSKLSQNLTASINADNTLRTSMETTESTATAAHNTQANNLNTTYDDLIKAKGALQVKFNELDRDVRMKIAKISELSANLMKIKTDKEEAVRLVKAEIAKVKEEHAYELQRLNMQQTLLNNEIKKYNDHQTTLADENQKIITLDGKFQNQISKVAELNVLIDNLEKEQIALDVEISVWVGKFAALENKFKKIEDEISTYLKKGEVNLEYISELLKEKRIAQDQLFAYSEDKYNSQTHLIDDVNLEMSPSELLENNQQREIIKNTSKFDKMQNDISSISKTIQIKKNEYRKKSFYIFLLTNAFIFLVISLIVVLLMKQRFI